MREEGRQGGESYNLGRMDGVYHQEAMLTVAYPL